MNLTFAPIIAFCWITFYVVWMIAALFTKRTAERTAWRRGWWIWFPVAAFMFVVRRAILFSVSAALWQVTPLLGIVADAMTVIGLPICGNSTIMSFPQPMRISRSSALMERPTAPGRLRRAAQPAGCAWRPRTGPAAHHRRASRSHPPCQPQSGPRAAHTRRRGASLPFGDGVCAFRRSDRSLRQ